MILFKREDRYDLYNTDGQKRASSAPNPFGKLSKKNCDELFGIYSPSELSKVLTEGERGAFEFGYCLAREHNKDKVFTLEDMERAFKVGFSNGFASDIISTHKLPEEKEKLFNEYIQSIQQPKEIDVEIEMEDEFIFDPAMGISQGHYLKTPKLDDDGCIILKRVL